MKAPQKTQKNSNLLKIKRIVNTKISAEGGPVFTFSPPGGGRLALLPSVSYTTVCGYVDRGQQKEIKGIHPPPTNSKNILKSFGEVGCGNLRQMFLLLVRG